MSFHPEQEQIASIVVDALALGNKGAARKWGLSLRSVERYRAQARTDAALAAIVAEKHSETSHDLATLRVAFLRDALQALREKLPTGTLYEVAGAIKIVGELHQTACMVDDDRPDDPRPDADETTGRVGGTAGGAEGPTPARH